MPKIVTLTFAELAEIDQLSYWKANTILGEAQTRLQSFDYDLAVRRAQEAFELYLKSLFRFLRAEYPATHDVKKQIYELTAAFKQHQIEPHQISTRQIARLVLANSMLHLWRLPAFYGDETLSVGGLFEESEAKLALSYAELAQFSASPFVSKLISELPLPCRRDPCVHRSQAGEVAPCGVTGFYGLAAAAPALPRAALGFN